MDVERASFLRVAGRVALAIAVIAATVWNPTPVRAGNWRCGDAGRYDGGRCSPGGDAYDFRMLHNQTQMTPAQRAALLGLANKTAWTHTDFVNAAGQLRSAADTMRAITFAQMDRFNSANFQTLLEGITPQQERDAYNKLVAMGYTKSFATYDAFVKKFVSLMKQGVGSYDTQGFYNAFLSLADVLENGDRGEMNGDTCKSIGIASAGAFLYAAVLALVPGGQAASALCGLVGAGLALAYSTC